MKQKRILVVGDVIADVYRGCVFKKMCPDAPDVKAIVETSLDVRPGGAANVAVNLASLTRDVAIDMIGILDVGLARRIKLLSGNRVDMLHSVFESPLRKERVMLDGKTLYRVDSRDHHELLAESVARSLEQYLDEHDPELIVMSDYGSGTIDRSLPLLLEHRRKLLVDTKIQDLSVFGRARGRTLLVKLNDSEWRSVQHLHHSPEEFFSFVVVTHGERGASLIMRSDPDHTGRTVCQTVVARGHSVAAVDVCGCGDTFLAGMAAAMLSGKDPYSSIQFANAAAAVVVGQTGTAVADLDKTLGMMGMDK